MRSKFRATLTLTAGIVGVAAMLAFQTAVPAAARTGDKQWFWNHHESWYAVNVWSEYGCQGTHKVIPIGGSGGQGWRSYKVNAWSRLQSNWGGQPPFRDEEFSPNGCINVSIDRKSADDPDLINLVTVYSGSMP